MNLFDDENEIMRFFQGVDNKDVFFINFGREIVHFYNQIHNENSWVSWVDSSAKNAPPPDFFNEEHKIMMEIMRVDDHAFKKKGKFINPTNSKESERRREIMSLLSGEQIKNSKIVLNVHSGLPTNEDHNYNFYLTNFKHVLTEHSKKIELYRKNHPGYKLAFFVFDESTPYIKVYDKALVKRGPKAGEPVFAEFHRFFLDSSFLSVFKELDIDYLVWFAPYKHIQTIEGFELPKVVIFNMKKNFLKHCIRYDTDYIMPAEE